MTAGRPTSYEELLTVLDALPLLVREKRRRDGLTLRAAGRSSGEVASTLSRFENGADINLSTARVLLRWVAS